MFFLKELPTQTMIDKYAAQFAEMDREKFSDALHMLRRASLLIRKLEAYFSEHGLSQTRFLILMVLDREPETDSLTIGDIVDRLDVSKPVVTNTLKTLKKDGLVKIDAGEKDRREKTVTITKSGCDKIYSILPGYYHVINEEMRS